MKYLPLPTSLHTEDHLGRSWRPWSLRLPFLLIFPILCMTVIICIELIVNGCTGGCRGFGKYSAKEINWQTTLVYSQLPMAASLALSLLSALPNHHVLRLEPYFQMSTPDGATVANSILLHYPYTFALFVPFQAAWQGHHVVLLSSTVALTMNFIVTPLISGMFNEEMIQIRYPGNGTRRKLKQPTDFMD